MKSLLVSGDQEEEWESLNDGFGDNYILCLTIIIKLICQVDYILLYIIFAVSEQLVRK
jgi:hypothetical protein